MKFFLQVASLVLFIIASLCAFGFHAHEPVAVVLGLDSAGLAAFVGSVLAPR